MALNSAKQWLYAAGIGILYVALHTIFTGIHLGDLPDLVFSVGLMLAADGSAFMLADRASRGRKMGFTTAFYIIGLTQLIIVLLLALNSAYNPLTDHKALNFGEIGISLVIFAFFWPLLLAAIIWVIYLRKRNAQL